MINIDVAEEMRKATSGMQDKFFEQAGPLIEASKSIPNKSQIITAGAFFFICMIAGRRIFKR